MVTAFDHEKLKVHQQSITFIAWVEPILESQPKTLSVREQLDRASTSVPLNIAEGNGKFTSADRCKFFDIARGSALECAACLDVLGAKGRIDARQVAAGKSLLVEVVAMLVGLIKSNSATRIYEAPPTYGGQTEE
ncbi:MAG TPA: four helix bundle protein [Chthoniobacter sp.]|jgi:four helix bundle protein